MKSAKILENSKIYYCFALGSLLYNHDDFAPSFIMRNIMLNFVVRYCSEIQCTIDIGGAFHVIIEMSINSDLIGIKLFSFVDKAYVHLYIVSKAYKSAINTRCGLREEENNVKSGTKKANSTKVGASNEK